MADYRIDQRFRPASVNSTTFIKNRAKLPSPDLTGGDARDVGVETHGRLGYLQHSLRKPLVALMNHYVRVEQSASIEDSIFM